MFIETIDAPATIDAPEAPVAAPVPMTDEQIKAMAARLKQARATRKQQQEQTKTAEKQRIDAVLAEIGPLAKSIGHKVVKGRKSQSST